MVNLLETRDDLLLTPASVLPEATYLLRSRLGPRAELSFAESVANQELAMENLLPADLARAVEVLRTYPQIGFVDATVVAVGERLHLAELVTTDRRHFSIIRPLHRDAFHLLP